MAFFTAIDALINSSVVIRMALLMALLAFISTTVVFYISDKEKYLEILTLKAENTKVNDALYRQNQRIRELGEQTNAQKKVIEQAVNKATEIANRTQKELDQIQSVKFNGTCDEKVRQSIEVIRGSSK